MTNKKDNGIEVINFVPHPGQQKVLECKSRFIFAMGGLRGGKTTTGCYWSYIGMQTPGTIGLIAAGTYDQLDSSVIQKFFQIFPQLTQYYMKAPKKLTLPNGSIVWFRSLDRPNPILGLNLHWEWIDEADGLNEETWDILRSRVATTNGRILATSSIYPSSWIYSKIYQAKDSDPDYELISWASHLNPSFPKAEWDKLKKEMDPSDFARNYGSEFVFSAGKVYEGILSYGQVNDFQNESKPLVTVFGIDFGVNDPSVILVMSYNTDGCWYIIDEIYSPNMMIQDINHWIEHFISKYGKPYLTVVDYAGGLARISLPAKCNAIDCDKDIFRRVTLIRDLIYEKRLYVFKKCVNAVREFGLYSFNPHKMNVPEDRYNHAMDAMGYVIDKVHPMVSNMANSRPEAKQMIPFWQNKIEQGFFTEDNKSGRIYLDQIDDINEY